MPNKILRIFISSPMDVQEERNAAEKILMSLKEEFKKYITIEPYRYEFEPMLISEDYQKQISDPNNADIFICILWSRLGTPLPDYYLKEDGTLFLSGTEYEFQRAYNSYLKTGKPYCMVCLKKEQFIPKNEEEQEQKKMVDAFINSRTKNLDGSIKGAINEFKSIDEFEYLLEEKVRKLIIRKFILEEDNKDTSIEWFDEPYRGLSTFDYEHAGIFFGRSRAIHEIKNVLINQYKKGNPFVIIFGMSGCGKSSLIKAGLLPQMIEKEIIEGIKPTQWYSFNPSDAGNDLLTGFIKIINANGLITINDKAILEYIGTSKFQEIKSSDAIKAISSSSMDKIHNSNPDKISSEKTILVIDQMEEMFTNENFDDDSRRNFIRILQLLLRSGLVWIIASARSDFYHRFSEIPELLEIKGGGQYDLLPPSITEIGEIIRYPALKSGLSFDVNNETGETLDDELIREASKDVSILPLLEFALQQLYEKRNTIEQNKGYILPYKAYNEIGGIEGALKKHADEILAGLPPSVQKEFNLVFRSVVKIKNGNDEMVVARKVPLGILALSKDRKQLVNAFINARLLISEKDNNDEIIIRVAHEALIRSWPRLKKLIEEEKEFLHIRENIENSMVLWEKEEKSYEYLIHLGKQLNEAEFILKKYNEELDESLKIYIKRSIKKAKLSSRLRGIAIIAIAVIIVGFSVFSLYLARVSSDNAKTAIEQKKEAEKQKELANEQSKLANENERKAKLYSEEVVKQKDLVDKEKNNAIKNEKRALAGELEAKRQAKISQEERNRAIESESIAKEEKEVALKNESKMITYLSNNEIENGDRVMATMLALEALPKDINKPERPYVSEAEWALQNSLYSGQYQGHMILTHNGEVKYAAFSKDGKKVVTTSRDKTAKIWDSESGKLLKILSGHTEMVYFAEFSPDGGRVVTASEDDSVKIWDVDTGVLLLSVSINGQYGCNATFSPDGKKIVTHAKDSEVKVWDSYSGKLLASTGRSFMQVHKIKVSNDGKKIIACVLITNGETKKNSSFVTIGAAIVIDIMNGKELALLTNNKPDTILRYAEFSADNKKVLTASSDNTAVIWDVESGKELVKLNKHTSTVICARFSPNGKIVITTSADNTARIWDAESGKELFVLDKHSGNVVFAEFSPDGKRVATVSDDNTVRVWDTEDGSELAVLDKHIGGVEHATFSPDGTKLITSSSDNTARIWDVYSKEEDRILSKHMDSVIYATFSHDGKMFITTSRDETARIWDSESMEQLGVINNHTSRINYADFSPDGKRVVLASSDYSVSICDVKSGKLVVRLKNFHSDVEFAQFSPDGKMVVTYAFNPWHEAILWNSETGEEIMSFEHDCKLFYYVNFSPDSKRIITYKQSWNNYTQSWKNYYAEVWDVYNKKKLFELKGFTDCIYYAEFSPDGKKIVVASADNSVKVWDSVSGKQLLVLDKHGESVLCAKFSMDNKKIITASSDNTARIWDAITGNQIAFLDKHIKAVVGLSLSPEGRKVLTYSSDGYVRMWEINSGKQICRYYFQNSISHAEFSPDGKRIIVITYKDISVIKIYTDINELINHAKGMLDCRELTIEERKKFLLDN